VLSDIIHNWWLNCFWCGFYAAQFSLHSDSPLICGAELVNSVENYYSALGSKKLIINNCLALAYLSFMRLVYSKPLLLCGIFFVKLYDRTQARLCGTLVCLCRVRGANR